MGIGNPKGAKGPYRVFYKGLGGGRNTRRSSYELDRNQLAVSINGWIPESGAFGKRPGNAPFLPNAPVGSGLPGSGLAVARFGGITSVIVQSGNVIYAARSSDVSYSQIATNVSAAPYLFAAELYNPGTSSDAAYIVNGVDAPRRWIGPGNMCTSLTSSSAPLNASGTAVITPRCVQSFLSSIWYASDPTEPTGVYISDPTQPESFTFGGQLPGAAYIPYLIGHNDGISGGDITGIMPIGAASMMVYKQSAIYRMDHIGYYGDIGPWDVNLVSPTVGMTSPKSLVSFDTFHAFLSVDGVYTCDGQSVSPKPVSDNNPDLLQGPNAAIVDRTTAVGARYGPRYLLFYDNGGL